MILKKALKESLEEHKEKITAGNNSNSIEEIAGIYLTQIGYLRGLETALSFIEDLETARGEPNEAQGFYTS